MRSDPTEADPFLRKVLDTYNSRRPDAFDGLLTEECTLVRDGAEARGREAVKRVLAQLYRAIPDLEYRIDDAVSSGDKVAIRWEGRGTHRGEYFGIPPTGSAILSGGLIGPLALTFLGLVVIAISLRGLTRRPKTPASRR